MGLSPWKGRQHVARGQSVAATPGLGVIKISKPRRGGGNSALPRPHGLSPRAGVKWAKTSRLERVPVELP